MNVRRLFCGALLVWLLDVPKASACHTCGSGDASVTTFGAERPLSGQWAFAAGFQHVNYRLSHDALEPTIYDTRLLLGLASNLTDWLQVSALIPVAYREVYFASLRNEQTLNIGDLDLRTRWLLFRDNGFFSRHHLYLSAGVRLPSSPFSGGSIEAQVGTGSVEPWLGAIYSYTAFPVGVFASVQVQMPVATGWGGLRNGVSTRASVWAQWHFDERFALAIGADARVDIDVTQNNIVQVPAGAVGFATLGGLFRWSQSTATYLWLRAPVIQGLAPQRTEGWVIESTWVEQL